MRAETPLQIGVLASGRGSNLQAIIDAVENGDLNARIALVMSNKKESEALQRARRAGIPAEYLDPNDFTDRVSYDHVLAGRFQQATVGLVVLAGYMRLVTSALIEPFRHRIINIHPSLLPSFPGLRAHRQALDHGVKISGCTVHFVEDEPDQGPIFLQACVPVLEKDTEETLSERILIQEHRLLLHAIRLFGRAGVCFDGRRVLIKEDG